MPFEAPWRDYPGLPDDAAEHIRRNFDEVSGSLRSNVVTQQWDAIVDPALAADDPATQRFKTVFSAINTMYGQGYTDSVRIGVLPGLVVETAPLTSSIPLTVLVGAVYPPFGGVYPLASGSTSGANGETSWDWDDEEPNWTETAGTLIVRDIGIDLTGGTGNVFTTNGPARIILERCYVIAQQGTAGRTLAPGCGVVFLHDTVTVDLLFTSASLGNVVWWRGGQFQLAGVTSATVGGSGNTTGSFTAHEVQFVLADGNTYTFNYVTNAFFDCWATRNSWGVGSGSQARPTIDFSKANNYVYWDGPTHAWGRSSGPNQTVSISVSSTTNLGVFLRGGAFQDITIPAPNPATPQASHNIDVTAQGQVDISGPAVVNICVGQTTDSPAVTIGGERVTGAVSVEFSGSSGTAIEFADDAVFCNIIASVGSVNGGGSEKPYNFVSGSTRNFLTIAGETDFAGAGTDSGTNNRIEAS
jgi:hypothetical protein